MRSRRCKDYKNNFAHLLNIIYQHTCPSCFMLFLAERSLLCFPWQGDIFYAEECGAEHEQLCCKNQHRTVDNPLWRYRHANSSEENCCRERCYRHILFHRHSFFKTITITITITLAIAIFFNDNDNDNVNVSDSDSVGDKPLAISH